MNLMLLSVDQLLRGLLVVVGVGLILIAIRGFFVSRSRSVERVKIYDDFFDVITEFRNDIPKE